MWPLLKEYESATGMKANNTKFEGIRMGRTKKKPIPLVQELQTHIIKWVKPNEYVKILGIPFWEDFDPKYFWDKIYFKTKTIISCWKDHAHLTTVGRNMLANSMIYGRFRYYIQAMKPPDKLMEQVESDAQALIWGGETYFDPEKKGTELVRRRFMKKQSQYANRKEDLGASVMKWTDHVKAIQAKWILNYLDATRGPWKDILDRWFAREAEDRGAVLTTIRPKDLCKSAGCLESQLPGFWRAALNSIRELPLTPAQPSFSIDGARCQPVWSNPNFELKSQFEQVWREKLQTVTIKDFITEDGTAWTRREINEYVEKKLHLEGSQVKVAKGKFVSTQTLLNDWHKIYSHIPPQLWETAAGRPQIKGYSETALHMMRNLGWQPGESIGKRDGGILEPVDVQGQVNKSGLGLGKRKKSRKARQEPIQAIILKNEIIYGRPKGLAFQVHTLSTKGTPMPTEEMIYIDKSEIRETIRWGRGVKGIAESSFPHPKEWRLGAIDKDLDSVTVQDLTREFTRQHIREPSCKEAWRKRLGELNWKGIGHRYTVGAITPNDFGSHYKLILHRALLTNKHNPDASTTKCRLCGLYDESIQHFGECWELRPAFELLRKIDKGSEWDDVKLNLFGMYHNKGVIPAGTSLVHFQIWKIILIGITKKGLYGTQFDCKKAINQACKRVIRKLSAIEWQVNATRNRAEARNTTPCYHRYNKWLKGIGEVDAQGKLSINTEMSDILESVE